MTINPLGCPPWSAEHESSQTRTHDSYTTPRDATQAIDGLSPSELALRTEASFTHVSLHGRIDIVLDISSDDAMAPFVDIIRKFHVPFEAMQRARQLGVKPPSIVRSLDMLRATLTDPNWLRAPMQFDLPANSQVFGRIVAAAGIHGILYPSIRLPGKRCLALFPQNWAASDSYVEVTDAVPEQARFTRLTADTSFID